MIQPMNGFIAAKKVTKDETVHSSGIVLKKDEEPKEMRWKVVATEGDLEGFGIGSIVFFDVEKARVVKVDDEDVYLIEAAEVLGVEE